MGRHVTIEFEVAAAPIPTRTDRSTANRIPASDARDTLQVGHQIPGIAPDKTFENFVVGACNQFAHAAARRRRVARRAAVQPLFICRSTGLGKTHLLHAIGNMTRMQDRGTRPLRDRRAVHERDDQRRRYHRMPEFRDKYRKHPTILLMDDVQSSGKDRTQEELFHVRVAQGAGDRSCAADVLPQDQDVRAASPRAASGMLATRPPDMETMMAILRQKAEDLGLDPGRARRVVPHASAEHPRARAY
jgi:chromosomal replication initiator protein